MSETAEDTEIRMAANAFKLKQAAKMAAEDALTAAAKESRDAYECYCFVRWGLKFGGRVKHKGDDYVAVGLHRYERFSLDRKPWIIAAKIKKDGTPSNRTNTVYDWEAT